ncbi:hypothetical protein GDO86_014892 [Hymenochirus boettgeri]|uniref:Ribosomal RNA-processing protein 14/surfeit locus protein 6 C-terminal domain-containing protein n=2 Tax=Hymenochirus TaxID=8361 RepID=A0A8T2JQQ3_9PIPI|nr:hypothetical protein GDO86_014892 [Hymenochirus boettgeri]KAG8447560.1 hypothetical protein GDO86_014892 [Hymenochirus boettgeri]
MATLASKDSYLQNLAKKVCALQSQEPQKRKKPSIHRDGSEEPIQPKKKKKKKSRKSNQKGKVENATRHVSQTQNGPQKPSRRVQQVPSTEPGTFSTVDILKKRLHEKIQESRNQASNKTLTPEEAEKRRQRRKQERERKKRKRKELKKKGPQETEGSEVVESESSAEAKSESKAPSQVPIVFNNMKVTDEPLNKVLQKKSKKEQIKGNITPLTGKNYKQLLSRLESRNNKLEELRAKDQEKANEFESKMKWTNLLYKAEGVKIKDDEGMLKTALKRKEKMRDQRKKRWDKRTEQTAGRMQQRQDKRHRNIMKKKLNKVNKKKDRARKKGRILPEDLAKAK